jgi:hypothetical protein
MLKYVDFILRRLFCSVFRVIIFVRERSKIKKKGVKTSHKQLQIFIYNVEENSSLLD